MNGHNLTTELNAAQTEAVCAPLSNLLVLAGAGSGKTRVLVHRIAWLLEGSYASVNNIFAVTFTNKAANEMRERLAGILEGAAKHLWVGTFHGLALRILRRHPEAAGLERNFQVIDSDDQLRLVKRIMRRMDLDEDTFEAQKIRGYINKQKDDAKSPTNTPAPKDIVEQVAREVYIKYQEECDDNSIIDFAEILLRCYQLLMKNSDILDHMRARFRHFLVDEFQDTNTIQYLWLKLLAGDSDSVTLVGDDDQSIYGWRGAKIENIKSFQHEFSDVKVVRLEQNYRSTSMILNAANALIENNTDRMEKTLWTEGEDGEPITLYVALNEDDEALYMVRQIKQHIRQGANLKDIAILYRSNAQSRVIEEAMMRSSINYSVYGGLRFFERAEIKDALAYLRLALNTNDSASFERIINVPPRGIGKKSIDKIREYGIENDLGLFEASRVATNGNLVTSKARAGVESFIALIGELGQMIAEGASLTSLVEFVVARSGLVTYLKAQKGEKAQSRIENLEELVNATTDFGQEEEDSHVNELVAFLSYTSLEQGERQAGEDAVQLMTLHSAKGLEFPVVFICGMEESLFPHQFAINNIEEERRLCYVGITRAMQSLYLVAARRRRVFGREEIRQPSRFIGELPSELIVDKSRDLRVGRSNYHQTPIITQTKKEARDEVIQVGDSGLILGQKVRHTKFGVGTVIDYEGIGPRARVSVKFEDGSTKWLALAYANLEPI